VPYEIAFTKKLEPADASIYINDCCFGGDVVTDRLLPAIRARYGDVQDNQEDWGWFVWIREGPLTLAVDVFCDDPTIGEYRIHVLARRRRWLFSTSVIDAPEVEELKGMVVAALESWIGSPCKVSRIEPGDTY